MPSPSVTLRFLASPHDVLMAGSSSVHGGRVLQWVDKASYACAVGWSSHYCVTAYFGHIHFDRPIPNGHMVEVRAKIAYTGRTSMHIVNEVLSADPRDGEFTRAADCMVIFVAMDENRKPTKVPQWEPTTEEEIQARDAALARFDLRRDIEASMRTQTYTADSSAPELVTRFLAKPSDVNWGGKVHGGTAMEWIDECATACTMNWSGRNTIAVYAGGIRFYKPMSIGDLIEVRARLLRTGTTSMHMSVHVYTGEPRKGRDGLAKALHSSMTYVAVDDEFTPQPIPHFTPATDEDKRLHAHSLYLQELRDKYAPPPLLRN
ncbi:acyl-CoA thioesterase [Corynebacterium sp. TAE3-ERU12]|uniref:acyl-CoA thioesterase n=1 Tax=Corynebacterium sp. TAE3-ERU12 TaxID=2849491 RepID=UPI001C467FEE|nr:acyl-CoA thioesterase [Corynebacterium sp. TAE3-ERU12]MBV7295860.1 acyl-CoA thioesterase [Corynebacterium sp. TAE3-ERU12]